MSFHSKIDRFLAAGIIHADLTEEGRPAINGIPFGSAREAADYIKTTRQPLAFIRSKAFEGSCYDTEMFDALSGFGWHVAELHAVPPADL